MPLTDQQIGEWLVDLRTRVGLRQDEVDKATKRLGARVSQSYLSQLERGVKPLSSMDSFRMDALRRVYKIDPYEWARKTGVSIVTVYDAFNMPNEFDREELILEHADDLKKNFNLDNERLNELISGAVRLKNQIMMPVNLLSDIEKPSSDSESDQNAIIDADYWEKSLRCFILNDNSLYAPDDGLPFQKGDYVFVSVLPKGSDVTFRTNEVYVIKTKNGIKIRRYVPLRDFTPLLIAFNGNLFGFNFYVPQDVEILGIVKFLQTFPRSTHFDFQKELESDE